jgi:hypothetical protein
MSLRTLIVQASLGAAAIALAVTVVSLMMHPAPSPGPMIAAAVATTTGFIVGLVIKWRRSQHSSPS